MSNNPSNIARQPVPKRVFFYVNMFGDTFTGGPRVVFNFAQKIDRQRFEPTIITNVESELTDRLRDIDAKYIVLSQKDRIGTNDGEVLKRGTFNRVAAAWQTLQYNNQIYRILREGQCDLLWVRNIKSVLLTGVAARRLGIPLIWDIGMEKTSRGFIQLLHNTGFRLATRVITESSCVADSIFTEKQILKNRAKLGVVKSGIPDDRVQEILQERSQVQRNEQQFRIINIASVCQRKNQAMIIRSILPLLNRHPEIHVTFVGNYSEPDYLEELKQLISKAGAEEHFEFLGWRSDATRLLVNSDLFVLSSYVEGVPYSVLESIHAGVPVVSSRCGGVPDVIRNNETGMLVDCDDDAALTKSIEQLVGDRQILEQLAENAHRYVMNNHTSDRWCATYMDLFDQLIETA